MLLFFHDNVGFSWGFSIIALTIVVRAALIPLTWKQIKSMQAMQRVAPQIKELQAKYKDDKQRLQQETMKFYQENKINPFASCLPLAAADAGVHLALLHAAQGPAARHLPGHQPADGVEPEAVRIDRSVAVLLHPGHHGQGHGAVLVRAGRHVRRLAAAVERVHVDHDGPQPAAAS